jgi:hypothetical protein
MDKRCQNRPTFTKAGPSVGARPMKKDRFGGAGGLPYAVTASSPKNVAREISAERSQGSEPYLIIFSPETDPNDCFTR